MGLLIDPYKLAERDPYWSSVVLLLPLNGANAGTTFTDYSDAAESMSAVSGAALSTAEKRFGSASLALNGSTDYIAADAASANYDFSNGHFTIECWIYSTEAGRQQNIVGNYNSSGGWLLYKRADNQLGWSRFLSGSGASANSGSLFTIPLNTWTHIAVCRNSDSGSSQQRLYINGVLTGGFITGTTAIGSSTGILRIGSDPVTAGRQFSGYIDDFRITKGVGRYYLDFTPPAGPYPTS